MKTFIYTVEEFKKRTRNNRLIRIYSIKFNKPIYLGYTYYTAGSIGGINSECFRWLIANNYIPKKLYNLSKNSVCGPGYYCPEVENKGYTIIGL